ncbi:PP2C family protein-serine/threonine phosphatase [Thermomonospora umbrina]|uniref:Stage II sporulation protein E n=1 Tax=Thermomonospora umbrina TaxID=111806 RepID=A0A3D9SJ54_9ACTN|nr:PP2C family protein-serine/threonine phosphatase [Thermomonospora umbrina]REE95929.1 stage II sporulation protein E [Thermomonospora umbrina]
MVDVMDLTGYRVLDDLMHEAEALGPHDLPELVGRAADRLGLQEVTIYLADVQQDVLIPLPDPQTPERPVLQIDEGLAGWCYRTASIRIAEAESNGLMLWLPLADGIERIGVLSVRTDRLDVPILRFCRSLAALLSLIVLTKGTRSDSFTRLQRTEPMRLPAEMVWAFLPPRTLRSPRITSSAVLEPAYAVGGDGFDHSLIDQTLHATILDAMGHDLRAGLTTSVAMAGCRNARRNGFDLRELAESVDQNLSEMFPDRYCTGIFAHVDLPTGELTWVNCGHPVPLLIRDQRVVTGALERPAETPLGLGSLTGRRRRIQHYRLQPGDRVLLYTDGVTEARTPDGERFGLDSFTDFIIRATAAGEPAYEVLRRLIHAVLAHHDRHLEDDATIVLFEWLPAPEHPAAAPTL